MTSVKREYFTLSAHQRPTVGDTKTSAVGTDHLGWLLCDGRLLNISDFRLLFDIVGYSFGGSGAQFRLPDPAGRVAGYIGSGSGLSTRQMGDLSGAETHQLTVPELAQHRHTGQTDLSGTLITINTNGSHFHTITAPGNTGSGYIAGTDNDGIWGGGTTTGSTNTEGDHNHSITDPRHRHAFTTQFEGSNVPHNNIQPTIFVGNLFMYSGKALFGTAPFTTVTPWDSTKLIY
jgi:microcystin-dependent protein